jgi:hypothetical protein
LHGARGRAQRCLGIAECCVQGIPGSVDGTVDGACVDAGGLHTVRFHTAGLQLGASRQHKRQQHVVDSVHDTVVSRPNVGVSNHDLSLGADAFQSQLAGIVLRLQRVVANT